MKKLFNILLFVFVIALLTSTASALSILAKFESSQTTHASIMEGDSDEIILSILISSSSPLLEVEGKLFEITDLGVFFVKDLFSDSHSGSFVYSPNPFLISQEHYEGPGNYFIDIKATETNSFGNQIIKSELLYLDVSEEVIPNVPPVANFSFVPLNPVVGEQVTFTSTSYDVDGSVVLEQWYFDGVLVHQFAEQGSSFLRTFSFVGSYEVTLKVTDNDGAVDEITKVVVVSEGVVENVPPVANFSFVPLNPVVGEQVTFTSTSYDVDGSVVLEQWYLNNVLIHNFNEEQSSFNRVFNEAGSYNVRLRVVDNDGAVDEITKVVVVSEGVVENVPPVANFSFVPENPIVYHGVLFTSLSYDVDGYIVDEKWYLDGVLFHEGVNETSITISFQEVKTYVMTLVVTDNEGATDEITKEIVVSEGVVENVPPVANFSFVPENPLIFETIIFTSTSYDVDGFIVNEQWFVDDVLIHEGVNETVISRTFTEVGSYNVRLRVVDNDGATDEITKTIVVSDDVVENIPPVANFTFSPENPEVNEQVTFMSLSYDVDGFIVNEQWFVDDVLVFNGVNETSFNHVFIETGAYQVTLRVVDNVGAVDEITKTIVVSEDIVENILPVARFIYSPVNPFVNTVVTFTSTSYDVDGFIVLEEWDFDGDNVFDETGSVVQKTFTEIGVYYVTLRVTDNDGATDSVTRILVVSEAPNVNPVANFQYNPMSPEVNEQVTFMSTSYDVDGFIVNEQWFINNALVHEGVNETSFSRTFNQEGSYEVTLIVTDNRGATNQITRVVAVSRPLPVLVAIIRGPESPFVGEEVTYDGSDSYDSSGAEIVSYAWIVRKDGNVVFADASSSPFLNYVFPSKGQYYLTLVVTNEVGDQAETTLSVYASRLYGDYVDFDFGQPLSVDYFSVSSVDYGVVRLGEEFTVSVTVTNNKAETLSNMRASFSLPEFGVVQRSGAFTLRPGQTRTIEFYVFISEFDFIPLGDHDALIGVAGQGITRYKYFPMTIIQ
ncbi:PKD domain-containing protein [Candidatus Woesearchaeota archaeon]|nr:PKD domain-containing protein [Candidatus Woesearchaeota archaeon]